jgi:uncharacterized protein (TIGR03435 family)
MVWLSLYLCLPPTIEAQTFEVASIKPTKTPQHASKKGGPGTTDPGRIVYESVSMRELIEKAYELKSYELVGPKWMDTERYDLSALVPPGSSISQLDSMLRNLLEQRFGLKIVNETRSTEVFDLVVGRNGSRLKRSAEIGASRAEADSSDRKQTPQTPQMDANGCFSIAGRESPLIGVFPMGDHACLVGVKQPVSQLAAVLSRLLGRPVVDQTGLPDYYNFVIAFAPERLQTNDGKEEQVTTGVGLAAALGPQTGLRLEARRRSIRLAVIGQISKIPAEN